MNYKISVFCIWRDSEKWIHRTLKQLEELESLEGFDFSFFFYENDSCDNTASILENWMSSRSGLFCSEKLQAQKFGSVPSPERMKLLCDFRNKCKALALNNDSDYSLLIDGDIEFSKDNFLLQLEGLWTLPNAVMTTPNVRQNIPDFTFNFSPDSYYDVYPFRDRYGNQGVYFADCPSPQKDDQMNWKLGVPIYCMSAFGGFAIIKSTVFNKVSWSSDLHCDHVNMCYDISRQGRIYCLPRSRVYSTVDLNSINLDSCKNIASEQIEFINKYF